MAHRARRISGQGMTEYIIIIGMIVILTITCAVKFGNKLEQTASHAGNKLDKHLTRRVGGGGSGSHSSGPGGGTATIGDPNDDDKTPKPPKKKPGS